MKLKFVSSTEDYTRRVGREFGRSLYGNEKICLMGPLGAGKTTFVRGFVQAFGVSEQDVQSPTFTLVREYGAQKKVYHIDLYRFDNEEEIFEAGIFDLLEGDELVLIEWADRLQKYFPKDCIEICFSHGGESVRVIEIGRQSVVLQ
jgi:tRNA threonylcarbamoyladenosine biosynthesis protein TsaE